MVQCLEFVPVLSLLVSTQPKEEDQILLPCAMIVLKLFSLLLTFLISYMFLHPFLVFGLFDIVWLDYAFLHDHLLF